MVSQSALQNIHKLTRGTAPDHALMNIYCDYLEKIYHVMEALYYEHPFVYEIYCNRGKDSLLSKPVIFAPSSLLYIWQNLASN